MGASRARVACRNQLAGVIQVLALLWVLDCHGCTFPGSPLPQKMVKRGGLRGGQLMVPCSGFYVHLNSVFPLLRFEKGCFGELIYRFR